MCLFEDNTVGLSFFPKDLRTAVQVMCNMLFLTWGSFSKSRVNVVLNYIFRELFLKVFKGGGGKLPCMLMCASSENAMLDVKLMISCIQQARGIFFFI